MMASLAVFDPSPLFRAGLAALVSTMGFDPVEEATDPKDLLRRDEAAAHPDLILLGLPQNLGDIPDLMQDIKVWAPGARVVVIAQSLERNALNTCFAAGASGYLLENITREGLKHSLLLVNAGENVFPSELADALNDARFETNDAADVWDELRDLHATEREVEILRCLANGDSNSTIARRLGISETAVSANVRQILKKLRVTNRIQAALWAVAKGLAASADGDVAERAAS